ncbi:HPP family protein [Marinibactrum halimedae]|uniref:HPP transmembrane region domain-containing protein n=1 Tax=Marinibactrum halimedae TaxID=1444977 RepID=A0AA37T7X4_9GAMM|nr:HPP family protein [Marinibactrum halimedae]MCD9460652.1 HPP family protein [Marinibactrum halimedae]GLS24297.1 hypothetical protein GCM10007877_00080 [Marinibactrum halimedae]
MSKTKDSYIEDVMAGIGCGLALFLASALSYVVVGEKGFTVIAPSMGAAVIILFFLPQSPMSKVWALVGGNVVSAMVGVTAFILFGANMVCASVAVMVSIIIMCILRCLHPPGGATALAAVVGGPAITDLGYGYVVFPTLVNCISMTLVLYCFNRLFIRDSQKTGFDS